MKIQDFSKVDVFQKFLNENYDKCFMDDIDYSINEKVLDKWQDCLKSRYITNLEDTKRMVETKFLAKDNMEELASITEQDGKNILDFSNVVRSNLIRIKFKTLLDRTNKISNELIDLLRGEYKNHKIVIVIDNHLYSSNTWYTMLIMKPLFDIIDIKNRIVNVIDKVSQFQDNEILSPFDPINNQQSQVLNENEKIKSSFLRYKNTFFIHADDMSYSGQQLLCNIPTGLKYLFKDSTSVLFRDLTREQYTANPILQKLIDYTTNRYFIAIPYIGSQAISRCFPQLDNMVGGYMNVPFRNESIFMFPKTIENIQSLSHGISITYGIARNESIHETLSKPYFRKLFRYQLGSLPIFFDHKLADAVSTLTYIISFSSCSTVDEKELIIGHMVNNCNAPPISELLNYKNKLSDMCLIDFKSESNRCPKSFYKTLTYTYNGISIPKKIFRIMRLIFIWE